ncbi:EexN family lipoprotein [Phenylobacterium sp.]|uniref:EexN family lipoprotein n=1 Tax=Phenylobacterium sp. TaxID=1871053 RepID=UPI0035622F3A
MSLLACAAIAGCSAQPRSLSFFAAHLDAAKSVVADCRSSAHRGPECEPAEAAVAAAARDARMREFHKAF